MNTMTDLGILDNYISNNYFPTHGESCNGYGSACDYIDTCHNPDLPAFFVDDKATDTDADFDYVITLEELMGAQS